jgi:predicted Ser/Thr protein kinase
MKIAMLDERAGPNTRVDHADSDDPHSDTGEGGQTPASGDPRTTIAGRYSVNLQTTPVNIGIAVAYQGRDLRTRDPVLVKTLRLEYRGDPEMRARFRREARLLQFLSHPNVIRALYFSEERGAPWLVLERIPGRTLREEIGIGAPFTPEEVVPLLNGLATALDHLHARGLVHLDLRPENVVVTPDGEPKLVDFGIAQTAGALQTVVDGGATDRAYLAPEQVCGEPVTAATDVFALGCLVYELLTEKPPYQVDSQPDSRNAALRARLEQTPVPPTVARGDDRLPAWVDDVVLGALERLPQHRYGSTGSFAAVFNSGVEGDVDVETGRPRAPLPTTRQRHFPINEPGIAVKGSPRLASRRAEPVAEIEAPGVIDADLLPVNTTKPVAYRRAGAAGFFGLDVPTLVRRLWQTVIVVAVLNVILMVALLVTHGELPGIWHGSGQVGVGTTVRVAGSGLVARSAPQPDAEIVADLPDGGTIRISGEAVPGGGGLWWPVEVKTDSGMVSGYVPQSWVQGP